MKGEELEIGAGIKIPLMRSVLNDSHPAYRRLSGPVGFRSPAEFGLYRLRQFSERSALALPTAYRPAYQRLAG